MKRNIGPLRQVVVQPTPFCNLDCRYCYLPDRSDKSVMELRTVERIAAAIGEFPSLHDEVEFRWHAGEPLVVGRGFYEDAISIIEAAIPPDIRIRHSLQTNGTLIDRDWCTFFRESGMRVGVSVDGPADIHDRNRVTRRGGGTFEMTSRGIELLRDEGITFDIITVLTRASLVEPERMYAFWADLGPREVGLNIDETEGGHRSSFSKDGSALKEYRDFLTAVSKMQADGRVSIRELNAVRDLILFGSNDIPNAMADSFVIVAIDWKGDVTSFSPELLGMSGKGYPDFILGNVWKQSLEDMATGAKCTTLHNAIGNGVANCRDTCDYYSLCGGGAPVNKLFENGTFESTETVYCIARVQIPAQILLSSMTSAS